MTAIATRFRRMKAARYPEISNLRRAMKDGLVWSAIGLVFKPDDASSHWHFENAGGETVEDPADAAELLVEVMLIPDKTDVTCRLGARFGASSAGLWDIPAEGDEVAVLLPMGEVAFRPIIVDIVSHSPPARVSADRTVLVATKPLEIIAPSIVATDASGEAVELATKADVAALAAYVQGLSLALDLVHGVTLPPPPNTVPQPAGTTVLKAK